MMLISREIRKQLHKKRCLVTGAAGFIGTRLCEVLRVVTDPPVVAIDNLMYGGWSAKRSGVLYHDLDIASNANREQVEQLVAYSDIIFHLASSNLKDSEVREKSGFGNNTLGTLRLVRAAGKFPKERTLVFSSSASVYGDTPRGGATELTSTIRNKTVYGDSKYASELIIRAGREYHLHCGVSLRYANVYGPGQRSGKAYTDAITNMIRDALTKKRIVVSHPNAMYDFIHVDDVCRANLYAAVFGSSGDVYNIGTGIGTSIKELASLIRELIDPNIVILIRTNAVNLPSSLVRCRVLNCNKAAQLLKFTPRKKLSAGIHDVISWVRREY